VVVEGAEEKAGSGLDRLTEGGEEVVGGVKAEDLFEEHDGTHATTVGAAVIVCGTPESGDDLADIRIDTEDVAKSVEGAGVEGVETTCDRGEDGSAEHGGTSQKKGVLGRSGVGLEQLFHQAFGDLMLLKDYNVVGLLV
jgi:hypothetical protein